MKVLEYLEEMEEILDVSSFVPLTGKVMVDKDELLGMIRDIKLELPDDIEQAKWIKGERARILEEAQEKYQKIIDDANKQADVMVENDDIVVKAKKRADEIISIAEENSKNIKLDAYKYVENILYNFQEKVEEMNATHFMDMVQKMEDTFVRINEKLESDIQEIKDLSYETSMEND